jgi:rare lipoprotein A
VRINDRMPGYKNRVIDLSFGAAKQLDMISDGIVEVKIEIIQLGK